MPSPARFSSGVNNRAADHPLNQLSQLDPSRNFMFFKDMDEFTIAAATVSGWIVTQAAVTTAPTVQAANGGVVLLASTGAAAFAVAKWGIGTAGHTVFFPVVGKKAWLRSRFKTEDADQNNIYIGASSTTVDPFGTEPPDQFVFRSLNATPEALVFAAGKTAATEVTISLGNTLDDTFSTCTAYYDGKDTVTAWREDDTGLVLAAGSVSVSLGTLLPDVALIPTFGMQNKDAGADDFSIDYLMLVSER